MSQKSRRAGDTANRRARHAAGSPAARRSSMLPAAGLAALSIVVYANSLHGGFVLDNRPLILQDPRVQSATWDNVKLIFSHSYWWPLAEHGLYRPLTKLSYLLNYAVFGNAASPEGYHAVNIALHAANALLAYALGAKLTRNTAVAFFMAAIWAVHPVLTEATTNIVGRADLLAAGGVLSGLWCYLKSIETAGSERVRWLAGLSIAASVAIFSKESGIALAAVIAVQAIVWPPRRDWRRALVAPSAAIAIPFGLFLAMRSFVLSQATAAEFHLVDNPIAGAPFLAGRLTALRVIGRELLLLVWPSSLSTDYSYAQIPISTGSPRDWSAAIALLAAVATICWAVRRNRPSLFFALFGFVALLPVANLLFTTGTIMAERLLYLPALGFVACAILGAAPVALRVASPRVAAAIGAVIIAALGARTWVRNGDWIDDLTIWTSAVRAAPSSFETHRGLAATMYAADPKHANLGAVIAEIDRSLAILDPLPDRDSATDAYADAGLYYQQMGDRQAQAAGNGQLRPTAASLTAYRRSREILLRGVSIDRAVSDDYIRQEAARGRDPATVPPVGLPVLYERLAVTDLRLGETQLAIDAARRARTLEPLLPDSHTALAWVLAGAGRPDDAAVALVTYYVLSGDARILEPLGLIYRGGVDKTHCAIIESALGATLNTSCPLVRDELCQASRDAEGIYLDNRRPDLADGTRRRAAGLWGCTSH